MIFVTTGSRDYPFDRLINKLDELVKNGEVTEHIIAQIGDSSEPKHLEWYRFLDANQFYEYQNDATLVISHAGTGALVGALKKGKNLISVPRRGEYGEHIDDHQLQVSGVLRDEGYLREVLDINDLGKVINEALANPIQKKYDRPSNIISKIIEFIERG